MSTGSQPNASNSCGWSTLNDVAKLLDNWTTKEKSASSTIEDSRWAKKELEPIHKLIKLSLDTYDQCGAKLTKDYQELHTELVNCKGSLQPKLPSDFESKFKQARSNLLDADTLESKKCSVEEAALLPLCDLGVVNAEREVNRRYKYFLASTFGKLTERLALARKDFDEVKVLPENGNKELAVKAARLASCDQSLETVVVEDDFTTSSEVIHFPVSRENYERALIERGCGLYGAKEELRKARIASDASKQTFAILKSQVIQNRQTQNNRIIEKAKEVIGN
jgi:hypothetical protein